MNKETGLLDVNEKSGMCEMGIEEAKHEENGNLKKKNKTQAESMEELKAYMESIPDPNEGRFQELRDMIRSGQLITKEALRETAEKLARQFLGG